MKRAFITIIISGIHGRMGEAIVRLAEDKQLIKVVGGCDIATKTISRPDVFDESIVITDNLLEVINNATALDETVVIDFSSPESTAEKIIICRDNKTPIVIGTTGHDKKQLEVIKEASKKIPIVLAANMSMGINLLLKILADIAKVTRDDYDVEIVEAHHRLKKDAPSGTAMKIAQVLAEALGRNLDEDAVYARHGLIGKRTDKEIGIQTIRAGDIVGEHTVYFGGLGERIEITHKASSRDAFAKGALEAAEWIVDQEPGLYDMQDVLGLRDNYTDATYVQARIDAIPESN